MEKNADSFLKAKQRGDASDSKPQQGAPEAPGSVNPESVQRPKSVCILPELSNSG